MSDNPRGEGNRCHWTIFLTNAPSQNHKSLHSPPARATPGAVMTDVRAMALAFLDEVSAPLTTRQIEHALRDHGVSKSKRAVLASALTNLNIIAVTGKGRS